MSNKPKIKKDILEEEYITLAQLRRIVQTMDDAPGATHITMAYVCSWFKNAIDNFRKHENDIYMQGYLEGKKESENLQND